MSHSTKALTSTRPGLDWTSFSSSHHRPGPEARAQGGRTPRQGGGILPALSLSQARALFLIIMTGVWLLAAPVWAKREHIVHFQGTPHELHVFKIQGHKHGKTLMLIGGIQGNEPGGFLSADLYADMTLETGNLIVVPRANFYSIMLNKRGPNGDMNRKFDKGGPTDQELKIVEILKNLMAESDLMLNLHDGSGFYRPTHVSESMNPMRYGQSIIADTDHFRDPKTGQEIRLAEMAQEVCRKINQQIENSTYHFRFNNHRTSDPNTMHREQRGSATYYALTRAGIPAFGVETSKSLPTIELKVRHHNLAINAFMSQMGIVPEHPAVKVEMPTLRYLVVTVNNGQPMVVANKETLKLKRGDSFFVSHIEANYERGLSVDILGQGDINDARQRFVINRPTSVIIRKDHLQCGWIRLKVDDGGKQILAESNPVVQYFVVEINGQKRLVAAGQNLPLIEGDRLKLKDSWTSTGQRGMFALNFKGFVGDKDNNTGDDRGLDIATERGLMKKWSMEGEGRRYRVVAERGKKELGEFYIQLKEPSLDYLVIQAGRKAKYALSPDETLLMDKDGEFRVVDVKANFDSRAGLGLILKHEGGQISLAMGQGVRLSEVGRSGKGVKEPTELIVLRHKIPIGKVFLAPRPVTAGAEAAGPTG